MATSISRDVKLFISHPFCLPTGSCPVSRYDRRVKLEQMSKSLSSQGHEWNLFDVDGLLPAVLKKRKDFLLRTPEIESEEIKQLVRDLNKSNESTRKVTSVKHSSYYWDIVSVQRRRWANSFYEALTHTKTGFGRCLLRNHVSTRVT